MSGNDPRLAILRAVRLGASMTQALRQLDELRPKETIKLQLRQHLDLDDERNDEIVVGEFDLEHIPPVVSFVEYEGLKYSLNMAPLLDIATDGRMTWRYIAVGPLD